MMNGMTAPSLAEQETFSTKEVPIPGTVFEGGLKIRGCSLILDVALGPAEPMASNYCDFCILDWPAMESTLQMNALQDPGLVGNVMSNVLRWLQVHMCEYFLMSFNEIRKLRID